MTKRVAILISGGGSNMVSLVEAMTEDFPARPVLVLSNRPDAGGIERANALGVPTSVVDHRAFKGDRLAFEEAVSSELNKAQPDLVCLAGFMRIMSSGFVQRWSGKILNIHPSLLPKYPGLHTHARALEAGDAEAGCSVHWVTEELDGGPLLGQSRVPVYETDTEDTLAARVLVEEHKLYPAVLRRVCDGMNQPLYLP